jgi:hypothetical protein
MPVGNTMVWQRRPGPRLRRVNKEARATYVWGPYKLEWVGSTHGVWTVVYQGQRLYTSALLESAKQLAEEHHASRPT